MLASVPVRRPSLWRHSQSQCSCATRRHVGLRHVQLQSFADNFSGQWEGQSAVLSSTGQPEPLPEHIVPPALKEWDMVPHDWQTRVLSLTEGDALSIRAVRLTPTVGCEAEEEAEDATSSYQLSLSRDDGSCIGTSHGPEGRLQGVQISFSLSADTRLRIVAVFQPDLGHRLEIDHLQLHRERKYSSKDSPFQPLQAEGTVKAFALKARLTAQWLEGDWLADAQHWQTTGADCLAAAKMPILPPETGATALPLDSFFQKAELDGQHVIAVGTYLNDHRRYSAAVHVDHTGTLISSALGLEQLS